MTTSKSRRRPLRILLRIVGVVVGLIVVVGLVAAHYWSVPGRRIDHAARYSAVGNPRACHVTRIQALPAGGNGSAWSPTTRNVYIYSKPDAQHIDQIYQRNVATRSGACLTCSASPGGLPVNVNKGFASYDPSGHYLITQGVMSSHRGQAGTSPGEGYYQDIWAEDTQRGRWFNLTHYPTKGTHGALIPRLSRDGKHLAWAEVYKGAPPIAALLYYTGFSFTGPVWGSWRLDVADVVADARGIHLSHVRHFSPGDAYFYEAEDWSPDNRTLLFASSIGQDSPWKLSLWKLDTVTGKATPFTRFTAGYSEHGTFTNDGKKIVYMSSKCCHVDFGNPITLGKTFSTEMYIANVDGSDDVELTSFNTLAGKNRYVSNKVFFNPFDGRQAILEQQILPPYGTVGKSSASPRLLLTLDGDCGQGRVS